jgi:hypothetical protein
LIGVLTLAAGPLVAAAVVTAMMWCVHKWNWAEWAVVVVGGGLFIGLMFAAWRFARRMVDRRFRFSIREMFVGVAVIALLLATLGRWWLNVSHDYNAIQSVGPYGGYIEAPYPRLGQPRRNALYSWIGYDPFQTDRELWITGDRALAEVLEQPDRFARVGQLSFNRGVTSAAFMNAARLNRLPDLRDGQFLLSVIDDSGLERLSEWTNARMLFFNGCPRITDAGLANLVGMPKLEDLSLIEEGGGMVITDAGLVHVGQMKGLKRLMLVGLKQVTDAGLVQLYGLSNLEDLALDYTGVTAEGVRQLRAALPDCRVISDVSTSDSQNVRRIVVRKLAEPDTAVAAISDSGRIGDVLGRLRTITDSEISDWRADDPWPADYKLEFWGQSRILYEARIGQLIFEQNYRARRWTKWTITDEQEAQLLQLLCPKSHK